MYVRITLGILIQAYVQKWFRKNKCSTYTVLMIWNRFDRAFFCVMCVLSKNVFENLGGPNKIWYIIGVPSKFLSLGPLSQTAQLGHIGPIGLKRSLMISIATNKLYVKISDLLWLIFEIFAKITKTEPDDKRYFL